LEDHFIPGFEGRYFIRQGTIFEGVLKYGELRITLNQLIGDAFPFSAVVDNPKYYECATRHIRNMKICEILEGI